MIGRGLKTIPLWVWLAVAAYGAIEPLTHAWIAYAPPGDAAPTGLHTGDSHVYLHSMRMVDTDCYSPYASCHAPEGMHSCSYYSLPVHWMYGAFGAIDTLLGLDHFLMLGVFNGLGGAFYLLCVYVLLRVVAPSLASWAFALFLIGGGPGGLLYLVSGVAGWHDAPGFDAAFLRFANYELIEGAYLWPVLHLPRLYYTLPLGLAYLAFAVAAAPAFRFRVAGVWMLLLAATFLNMRVGAMVWGMMAVYLACRPQARLGWITREVAVLAAPVVLGIVLTFWVSQGHPTYAANQMLSIRETMLFSSLLSAALPHWLLTPRQIGRSIDQLNAPLRLIGWGWIGYLAAFVILYAGYQVYYGNYVNWIDVTSATVISDWALLGILPGLFIGWKRSANAAGTSDEVNWAALWVVLAVAAGLSAWGQGWFMQFLPRRLLVVLGLPLCLVTAAVLHRLYQDRRALAVGIMGAIGTCGVTSVFVAVLFFQGPLLREPGEGPFAYRHYELMTQADAEMLDAMTPGRVLAPMYSPFSFTEVIGLRDGMSLVCGVGTLNHSDLLFEPMKAEVDHFFSVEADDAFRSGFLQEWCADYVYCPDTCPVPSEVRLELDGAPYLRRLMAVGDGVVFEVLEEHLRSAS